MRITGYAAGLAETGPRRGPQNIFINGRMVRDKTITHAIIDAYSVASIKERSPEVHLFIEMPLDAVDVNVHPSKAEVRFREQSLIHELVRRALGDALGRGPAPPLVLTPPAELAGSAGPDADAAGGAGERLSIRAGGCPAARRAPPGSRLQAQPAAFRLRSPRRPEPDKARSPEPGARSLDGRSPRPSAR